MIFKQSLKYRLLTSPSDFAYPFVVAISSHSPTCIYSGELNPTSVSIFTAASWTKPIAAWLAFRHCKVTRQSQEHYKKDKNFHFYIIRFDLILRFIKFVKFLLSNCTFLTAIYTKSNHLPANWISIFKRFQSHTPISYINA